MKSSVLTILCSFNKAGDEGIQWAKELEACSDTEFRFIPFNHDPFLDSMCYASAHALDQLYRSKNAGLLEMYRQVMDKIASSAASVLFVTHQPPYHPDFLRRLNIFKAFQSTDDPDSTYRLTIPYLHAYDYVFFVDPAYSDEMTMSEKMRHAGAREASLMPNGVLDFECSPELDEKTIFNRVRDIDIIYVGAGWRQKIGILASVKKRYGSRFVFKGRFDWRRNLRFVAASRRLGWISEVSNPERTRLYQSAKIGINVHFNEFGLGNQRLYHLPANGVMQICDCGAYLDSLYDVGEEVVAFDTEADLFEKLDFYLTHPEERLRIARNGYRRVMRSYRFRDVIRDAARRMIAAMHSRGYPIASAASVR